MAQICHIAKINHLRIEFPENQPVDPEEISRQLKEHPNISHIGIVHCETTTGMINPIAEIGQLAAQTKVTYIVDAMSSFGGIPISMPQNSIDFLISSANKCIGGVPGFGFILAKREALLNTEGLARSLSLDLFAQWKALQNNGQFRFTPPTHSLLAFHRALLELEAEGGIDARYQRYRTNQQMLVEGMRGLGFTEYLPPELQGPIITSFNYPQHPNFCFQSFYDILNSKNFVIYPGKVSRADCFRIGHIGHIFKADIAALLQAIKETMSEMNIK
jgi:2-aminoethylphosphonate-pyruvate transaminase